MFLVRLTEGWADFHVHIDLASHALDSPYQPLLKIRSLRNISSVLTGDDFGMILSVHTLVVGSRQEIDDVHHALFLEIPRLENIACWKIVLLCRAKIIMLWVDDEVPALILVKYTTEY
jgi:hypothetical protein